MSSPAPIDPRLSTHQTGSNLQAWDAADRALLANVPPDAHDLTVLGARWGALTVSRAEAITVAWVDSAAGAHAMRANHALLGADRPVPKIITDWSVMGEHAAESGGFIVRVSQSVAAFEWQLGWVCAAGAAGVPVWLAGLARTWSKGHTRVLAAQLGPDVAIRGVGKARFAMGKILPRPSNPVSSSHLVDPRALPWRQIPGPSDFVLSSLPGVFSHGAIDPGARALLNALPATFSGLRVVDLGCGNGILGAEAGRRGAEHVTFTDDSALALTAARHTWRGVCQSTPSPVGEATFEHADAGDGLPAGEADIVLCNPPFHLGKTQTTHIVDAMLLASRRLLRRGGTLLLVGNRHLRHETRAPRVLTGVRVIHDDGRFSVLRARR